MKRWKGAALVKSIQTENLSLTLKAEVNEHNHDGSFNIDFKWDPADLTFADLLESGGVVPLPPYIHRQTVNDDSVRYQTVYATCDGSVAAPTAGLHFTNEMLSQVKQHGHIYAKVTLHIGVGTFRPVTAETIAGHAMHSEKILVSKKTIQTILNNSSRPIIAVGTTSARTVESLYWIGNKILSGKEHPFEVGQWDPYAQESFPSTIESLNALQSYMTRNHLEEVSGETRLLIMPGYKFKIITALVTNFHMPQSTLLLLVAAMVGGGWREAYDFALNSGFRFLSYGDSCLFFKR